jgi:hypothetical protein
MTNGYLIVSVDDVIAVYVAILNVARLNGREVLGRAGSDVGLVLKETDSLQTVDLTVRVTCLNKVIVQAWLLKHLLNLILGVHQVTTQVEANGTEVLGVIQTELETVAIYTSGILVRSIHTQYG